MRLLILLIIVSAISGCSKSKLPEYNRLESMRILALKADAPERNPGQAVTITPVISDIKGAGRTLTYRAEGCVDPGIGFGASADCNGASSYLFIGSGTVTGLSSPNYTAAVSSTLTFTIPTDVLSGKTTVEQLIGVNYIVVYKLTASDGTEVSSFKRIVVSTNPSQNANPTLSNIFANGSTINSLPVETSYALKPDYQSSAAESYTGYAEDGTVGSLTESLITSWFISEGSLSSYRTLNQDENTFSISFRPSSVVLVAVLRDNRGGEDYKIYELQ